MKVFVTGGYGFIGSYFVDLMLQVGEQVVIYDLMTYATKLNYNEEHSIDIFKDRVKLIQASITDKEKLHQELNNYLPNVIVNFAAESHVDRSLEGDDIFIQTNTIGVKNILEWLKDNLDTVFIQVSTDEVGGSLDTGSFHETDKLSPRNPYSASKAMAEMLCEAYHANFGVKVRITRGSNTYGPRQYPEKLIPKCILNLLNNKPVPIYDQGIQIRDWLYVMDHAAGIKFVLENGTDGQIYHIGGEDERKNIDVINSIFSSLGKDDSLKDFTASRQGHDFRYSLNCDKLKSLGWKQNHHFEHEMRNVLKFYKQQHHLNHIGATA